MHVSLLLFYVMYCYRDIFYIYTSFYSLINLLQNSILHVLFISMHYIVFSICASGVTNGYIVARYLVAPLERFIGF